MICVVAIEYLATTTLEIKPIQNSWDKANHFIAFLTLYVTLSLGYPKLEVFKKALILLAFGIQIEVVQYFLPNREFSLLDVLADGVGIVMGIIVIRGLWYVRDIKVRL
ncbi:VanZ family protein [Aliarcobacter cryaerophilus]|uniref:VanZ family protein n=1 Tax=Aliarcobacter cryaerophilus TaxID=28198 RepID=UPI003DA3772D